MKLYFSGDCRPQPEEVLKHSYLMMTKEKLRPWNVAQAWRLSGLIADRTDETVDVKDDLLYLR